MEAPDAFVRLYNSLYGTRHRRAASILRRARTDESDARIDNAFNALAVARGLRDLGMLTVPARWTPPPEMGLAHRNLWSSNGFVANAKAVTQEQLETMASRYGVDSLAEETNAEVGRRLGYLQPTVAKAAIDGWVAVRLRLPMLPLDAERDRPHTILSEFGPQSVNVATVDLSILRATQRRWNALAQQVDPDLHAVFELGLD